MSTILAASATQNSARSNRLVAIRFAFLSATAVAALSSSAQLASAQNAAAESKWELRFSSGAFVPAGDQRTILKDANASAAQLSWLVRPSLAVTGTFTWARSRDVASVNDPKLDVFTSDLGIEARPVQLHAKHGISFTPFAGIGGGARSYNYRKLDVNATHNLAGYGAIGGDLGIRRVGLRLEARDYATGFRPLVNGGKSETRNDVVIMAALRFKRHASQK